MVAISTQSKRKWGDDRREAGERGSHSSSVRPGEYIGVRNRGFAVEIKKWYEGVDFYKDVKMAEGEAALVHDLARLYVDPDCRRLNIQELESRIQREDPALATLGNAPVRIGKQFLVAFVENNPLAAVAGGNSKERADAMKDEIVALAPFVYARLKEKITVEHSSRAGRQKKHVEEIPRALLHGDDVVQLNKEIQDLKAIISAQNAAKDAEITSLEEAMGAEITSLKERNLAMGAEISALQEVKEAMGAEITSLKVACDVAEQKGRNAVMDELCAVNGAPSVTPFKSGVAERENFLQQNESNSDSESWMCFVDWKEISAYYHD